MAKLRKTYDTGETGPDYTFYCPGCGCDHGVWTTKFNIMGAIWKFDDNMDFPNVEPSIRIKRNEETLCHLYIKNGKIEYLADCRHELAGKTVEMEDIEQ